MHIQEIGLVSQTPVLGLSGKIQIPVSNEVSDNLLSARLMKAMYNESEKVLDYFSDLATKVGFFFGLPYQEIIDSSSNGLFERDLNEAHNEGYLRVGLANGLDGKPVKVAELTDKFCPLDKREFPQKLLLQRTKYQKTHQ